jgi:nucleoside-diphosphate-sugar epimerase
VTAYDLVIQKLQSLPSFNAFDVGTNVFTDVKDFVLKIAGELEKSLNMEIVSRLKFGAIPYRSGDIMVPQLDNTKLKALGWKQLVNISEGVETVIKNYK